MLTNLSFKDDIPKCVQNETKNGVISFKHLRNDAWPRRENPNRLYSPLELQSFVPYKEYYVQHFNLAHEEDTEEYQRICRGAANGWLKIVKNIVTPVVIEDKHDVEHHVHIEFFARVLVQP